MANFEHKVLEYIGEARERMTRIEEDLKEHKEGVQQNRARIEVLEEPRKALAQIKRWAMWLITVSAAAGILYEVIK